MFVAGSSRASSSTTAESSKKSPQSVTAPAVTRVTFEKWMGHVWPLEKMLSLKSAKWPLYQAVRALESLEMAEPFTAFNVEARGKLRDG